MIISMLLVKGQTKLTFTWHTPSNNFHIYSIFNASGLPEKYFLTPSHPNSVRYPILDEE